MDFLHGLLNEYKLMVNHPEADDDEISVLTVAKPFQYEVQWKYSISIIEKLVAHIGNEAMAYNDKLHQFLFFVFDFLNNNPFKVWIAILVSFLVTRLVIKLKNDITPIVLANNRTRCIQGKQFANRLGMSNFIPHSLIMSQ